MTTPEQVGVIPRQLANELGLLGYGFSPLRDADQIQRIEASITFADRPAAERDPTQKQIIPYGVVEQGEKVFLMERLTGGGEERLHGKLSLGVGGHINPIDTAGESLIHATMLRELEEELDIVGVDEITPYGFINDDSVAVGRVHLGVVYRIRVGANGTAQVRETDALRGGFRLWSEIQGRSAQMETWSTFVIDAFQAPAGRLNI